VRQYTDTPARHRNRSTVLAPRLSSAHPSHPRIVHHPAAPGLPCVVAAGTGEPTLSLFRRPWSV